MKKLIILVLFIVCCLFFVVYTVGCGSSPSTATTTTTSASTSTTTTTTSTSTTSTTTTTLAGLVAHYAFDDGSGTVATDSSGNSIDGVIYGPAWTTGRSGGYALSFAGAIGEAVKIPVTDEAAPIEISTLEAGSIALWFKHQGNAASSDGIFLPVFYMGPSPDITTLEGLIIEVGHKGIWDDSQELFYTVTVTPESSPILCFDSGFNLVADTWYHFIVTVDSSRNTGYLNGTEMTTREYNFPDSSGSSGTQFLSTVPGGILSIGYGRSAIDGTFYSFDGIIDDVQIYNRSLTSTEVLQLYQQ